MFEFYGEYFNDAGTDWIGLLINLLGIAFATLISWYIFTQGNKRQDKQEKQRLKELETYIKTAIPLMYPIIDLQITNCKKLLDQLKQEAKEPYHIKTSAGLHSKSFTWISR